MSWRNVIWLMILSGFVLAAAFVACGDDDDDDNDDEADVDDDDDDDDVDDDAGDDDSCEEFCGKVEECETDCITDDCMPYCEQVLVDEGDFDCLGFEACDQFNACLCGIPNNSDCEDLTSYTHCANMLGDLEDDCLLECENVWVDDLCGHLLCNLTCFHERLVELVSCAEDFCKDYVDLNNCIVDCNIDWFECYEVDDCEDTTSCNDEYLFCVDFCTAF